MPPRKQEVSPETKMGVRLAYRKSLWWGKLAVVFTLVALTVAVPAAVAVGAVVWFGVVTTVPVVNYVVWLISVGLVSWTLGGFCAVCALWKTFKVWLAYQLFELDKTWVEKL